MAFNHYAKLKRIIDTEPIGWYIRRIDKPTVAVNFNGEKVHYDYYYRLYAVDGTPIKYGKFRKIDKLAKILGVETEDLLIVSNPD